jgi:hypothetical protein
MKGFRSLLGLALLSAIVGCAIVAQTAAAAFTKDTNSTFVTCVEKGGKKDFSDAHCDKSVTPETGNFGHVKIAPKTSTPIVITNAKTASATTASTPAKFNVTLGGVAAELTATTVTGTGTIENLEPEKGKMTASGTVVVKYTGITVNKPAGCKVKEPVEVKAKLSAVSEGKKMGVQFEPSVEGANFTEFTFENNPECALNKTTVPVKGSAIATGGAGNEAAGSGATSIFEPGNGMESLKVGAAEATFTSTTTTRMAPVEGVEQNPIAITTGAE